MRIFSLLFIFNLFLNPAAWAQLVSFSHEEDSMGDTILHLRNPIYGEYRHQILSDELKDLALIQKYNLPKYTFVYMSNHESHLENQYAFLVKVLINQNSENLKPLALVQNYPLAQDNNLTQRDLVTILFENYPSFKKAIFYAAEQYLNQSTTLPEFIYFNTQRENILRRIETYKNLHGTFQLQHSISYLRQIATHSSNALDFSMNLHSYTLVGDMIFEQRDLGNFYWGMAMRLLEVPFTFVELGSEFNGMLNSRYQNGQGSGIIITGDSNRDQVLIRAGYFYPFTN